MYVSYHFLDTLDYMLRFLVSLRKYTRSCLNEVVLVEIILIYAFIWLQLRLR